MNDPSKSKQKIITEHALDVGKLIFYTNIVVAEYFEGVHLTKKNAIESIEVAKKIYGSTKPIVYISNRVHSYSIDPVGYGEVISMFPNLVGLAIVTDNKFRSMIASFEKLFIKRPISAFKELENAFAWSEQLINDIENKK